MRMAFSLVGILVVIGIIVLLMNQSLSNVQTGLKAKKDLEEKGVGALTREGREQAAKSMSLVATPGTGKFRSVTVESIVPGGVMQKHFGLQVGDVIVGTGGNSFDTVFINDGEDAINAVIEARGYGKSISIKRNGQAMELPLPATSDRRAVPVPTH